MIKIIYLLLSVIVVVPTCSRSVEQASDGSDIFVWKYNDTTMDNPYCASMYQEGTQWTVVLAIHPDLHLSFANQFGAEDIIEIACPTIGKNWGYADPITHTS